MSIPAAMSFAVLIALVGASSSVAQQSLPSVDGVKPDGTTLATSVTATGCLIQEPPLPGAPLEGHESASAVGLALKKAAVQPLDSTSGIVERPSAVPGTAPSGRGSETTSQKSQASRPAAVASNDRAFWIGGKQRVELSRYVGKRVQVTGVIERKTPPTSAISDRTTPAPGARQQTSDSAVAHPSAPMDTIEVQTFRVVEGTCS